MDGVEICGDVNYVAREINSSSLLSTTNYKEGAVTTITLSQPDDCQIYTYVNINIHTNDTTTAPIETVQALKYKILATEISGNNVIPIFKTKEYNGTVTTKGDQLLATVPLTTTPTTYTIYLWVDPTISSRKYHEKTYSGYIYVTSEQSSTIDGNDRISPTLFLGKETYIEGFNNWNLTNASVDADNVLTIAETTSTGNAQSDYYYVDGEYWYLEFEGYTSGVVSDYAPNGGINLDTIYYNSSYTAVKGSNNHEANGYAPEFVLNTWGGDTVGTKTFFDGYNAACEQVKNVKVQFQVGNDFSQPVVKIRNFKFWGQLNNSFYIINVYSSDNIGIVETKYAYGKQNVDYFTNNGTVVTENQVTVTQNGIYTFYTKDAAGNETINTIEIDKIV